MCGRCGEFWTSEAHRCAPTPAEVERELVEKVVEAAVLRYQALDTPRPLASQACFEADVAIAAAVSALQAHRGRRNDE
jgi:hypothetical protein